MNKLRNLAAIIFTVCLFTLPTSGFAKMTLMTEAELDQITAQAGFSEMLGIMQINQDSETGTYYFGGSGGYLSLTDMSYQGTVGIDPSSITPFVDSNGASGFEYNLDGPIVDISEFHTTFRLGEQIATGESLGTLYINSMVVNVHGKLRITSK